MGYSTPTFNVSRLLVDKRLVTSASLVQMPMLIHIFLEIVMNNQKSIYKLYPKFRETNQPSESDYIKCSEPRSEMCTMLYTDTCAFTEFPCYSDSCMKLTGSGC